MENLKNVIFSIVTVTLNPGGTFRETIESIYMQKLCEFEHIIKDGYSTDGSVVIDPLLHQRTRIVVSHDSSIYDAMNQAIDLCIGDYIIFLNAGDAFVSDEYLNEVALCIQERPGAAVYFSDVTVDGHPLPPHPMRISCKELYFAPICHQACVIKRESFKKYGNYDCSYSIAADHEFLLRLITHGEYFVKVPRVIVNYASGGFSTKHVKKYVAELNKLRQKYFSPVCRLFYILESKVAHIVNVIRNIWGKV